MRKLTPLLVILAVLAGCSAPTAPSAVPAAELRLCRAVVDTVRVVIDGTPMMEILHHCF